MDDEKIQSKPSAFSTTANEHKVDYDQWEAKALESLRGRTLADLVTPALDDIKIDTLYQRAKSRADTLGKFPFTRSVDSADAPLGWDIRQTFSHPDPHYCNRQILEELNGGVTSLHLEFDTARTFEASSLPLTHQGIRIDEQSDLTQTLKNVLLDVAPISLSAGTAFDQAAQQLKSLWSQYGLSAEQCCGAFNADPFGVLATSGDQDAVSDKALEIFAALAVSTNKDLPKVTSAIVDTSYFHDAGASPAQELGLMLASLKGYLTILTDYGLSVNGACQQLNCRLSVDADYFQSAAKLRAARTLWATLAQACGATDDARKPDLWAQTSRRMLSRRDPWVNILRTTVAASAAALGGASCISVDAFDSRSGLTDAPGRRIARNIAIILQEESSLLRVTDPLGGSGYIESLTDSLCAKAWEYFQQIEAEGGLAKALISGSVKNLIEQSHQQQIQSIRTRKHTLVGISDFPAANDSMPNPDLEAHTCAGDRNKSIGTQPDNTDQIVTRYLSEPFEAIRDRIEHCASETGVKPILWTVATGKPSDYVPRVQFCHNLLLSGGIQSNEPVGEYDQQSALHAFTQHAEAGGIRVALLCTGIKTDNATITALITELFEAGADHVFAACRPIDGLIAPTGKAPVEFVYQGCDAINFLEQVMDVLGVNKA